MTKSQWLHWNNWEGSSKGATDGTEGGIEDTDTVTGAVTILFGTVSGGKVVTGTVVAGWDITTGGEMTTGGEVSTGAVAAGASPDCAAW